MFYPFVAMLRCGIKEYHFMVKFKIKCIKFSVILPCDLKSNIKTVSCKS